MTYYNNDKLNEIFRDTWPNLGWAKRMNDQPYPDEMFEEAERREAENKALKALDKLYEENDQAFGQLAYLERLELEEKSKTEAANELYRDALHELDNLAVGDVDSEDFMNAYLIIQSALKVALGEEDV